MMSHKTYLAADLGASSGRVVAGRYDGNRLALETIRRFATLPIDVGGSLRIDLDAFLREILQGIAEAVVQACRDSGQAEPLDDGRLIRTILEGLALSYRRNLERLATASGRTFSCLHVVGGGSQNELLNQFIANACNLPVVAGPHEATSAGNITAQMMADGEVASLAEGRELISRSQPIKSFEPEHQEPWHDAYRRLRQLEDRKV